MRCTGRPGLYAERNQQGAAFRQHDPRVIPGGWMGLHFAHATLKMGHPVTVFLNLDGVKLASKWVS